MKNILSQTSTIPTAPPPSPIEADGLSVVRYLTDNKTATHSATKRRGGKMPRYKKTDARGYRKQFTFWLSCGYDWQRQMGDWLMALKKDRQFAATIRNALYLYRELQEGRADLLLEMFPWVKDALTPKHRTDPLVAELMKRVDALQAMVTNPPPAANPTAAPPAGQGGPKPLATIPTPPPDDDDDALTVTVDKDAGQRSATNFIKSAFALNGMTYDQ